MTKVEKGQLWRQRRSRKVVEIIGVSGDVARIKIVATGTITEAFLDRFGGDLATDFTLERGACDIQF